MADIVGDSTSERRFGASAPKPLPSPSRRPMTFDEIAAVVAEIDCALYRLGVHAVDGGFCYLQVHALVEDTHGDGPADGAGRKWMLSPHMVRSEVVQTALAACLAFAEHEVREHFRWRARRVFNPHTDVLAHWEICEREERR